jgi:phosphatidylglycerophosphate synthase
MRKYSFYLINAITLYRLTAAPVLVVLLLYKEVAVFKWLLAFSFFTDMIDGSLARKFRVTSMFGSKMDSLADDLTVAAGIAGLVLLKPEFLRQQLPYIIPLLVLFLVQVTLSIIRYRKFSSFHTRAAKLAALFQGVFLILVFFLPQPPLLLFYAAVCITAIDLVEEIILIFLLREWQTDVKGIYWVLKKRRRSEEKQAG